MSHLRALLLLDQMIALNTVSNHQWWPSLDCILTSGDLSASAAELLLSIAPVATILRLPSICRIATEMAPSRLATLIGKHAGQDGSREAWNQLIDLDDNKLPIEELVNATWSLVQHHRLSDDDVTRLLSRVAAVLASSTARYPLMYWNLACHVQKHWTETPSLWSRYLQQLIAPETISYSLFQIPNAGEPRVRFGNVDDSASVQFLACLARTQGISGSAAFVAWASRVYIEAQMAAPLCVNIS